MAECHQACPGMSIPLKIVPLHGAIWTPHLAHGSLGSHEFWTASQSVQPFLHGSLQWLTYRQTDRQRYSVCNNRTIGRIYVCSTAMQRNNNNDLITAVIPYLLSESQHKGSSVVTIRSLVVDEERMRPGHWLWLVLCVPFSALTLWLASRQDIRLIKTRSTYPGRFCLGTDGGGDEENRLTQVHVEKQPLNGSTCSCTL